MPLKPNTLVVADEALIQAVESARQRIGYNAKTGTKRSARNSMSESVGVDSEYSGEFKIVDVSDGAIAKVKVINGNDTTSDFCGRVYFDGGFTDVNTAEFEVSYSFNIFLVKSNSSTGFKLIKTADSYSYSSYTLNTYIGRVVYSNGNIQIIQYQNGSPIWNKPYSGDWSINAWLETTGNTSVLKFSVKDGYAYVNKFSLTVQNKVKDITLQDTATRTIYFSVDYNSTTKTFENAKIDIGTPPSLSGTNAVILLARVYNVTGSLCVEMNHYGVIQAFVWGECSHDDE